MEMHGWVATGFHQADLMYCRPMVLSNQATPPFLRMAAHPLRWRLLTELAASDYRVRELTERLGQPQNLVSYHLRLLRGSGLVTARRSNLDARDTYYHLDLDRCADGLNGAGTALHPALRLGPAAGAEGIRRAAPGAVRLHRQQRSFADRRGPARPSGRAAPR